ncbi:hypothetical protein L484_015514 [Morus notabilis]|uniref:Uncharacterized protein n=1 Tax=Morus notabilis TaxID=981085 RepID=W9RS30_9ROSA|nr:hypothetical protein L484_015514 [Morus notabilis]
MPNPPLPNTCKNPPLPNTCWPHLQQKSTNHDKREEIGDSRRSFTMVSPDLYNFFSSSSSLSSLTRSEISNVRAEIKNSDEHISFLFNPSS